MYSFYYYPDTQILKNKYGIMNEKELNAQCSRDTAKAIVSLRQEPLPEKFDSSYLKYLHKCLFANTFEWAGHTRNLPFKFEDGTRGKLLVMRIPNSNNFFVSGSNIKKSLQEFDKTLSEKNNLQGLSRKEFIEEAVKLFSFLNYIHPFRTSNGRAQRMFFEKLAEAAGHRLDFSVVTKQRMIRVCNDAIPVKGNINYEGMKHLFEDISNPEKVYLLKKFVCQVPKAERKNLNNKVVIISREGMTYEGLYIKSGLDSVMIETKDFCVICHKDYLTPEQLKTLKPGNQLTVTVPINDLNKILIPAEKLAPLTEDDIIKKIENDAGVQASRKKIEELSKLVYGNSKILNSSITLIHTNFDFGSDLSKQIINSPKSISKLLGYKILGIRSPARKNAESNISALSTEVNKYVDMVLEIKYEIIGKHKAKEKRLAQTVKMPSKEMQDMLNLSRRMQIKTLESSPALYTELTHFMRKITLRLSTRENQGLRNANYKELSESIGISENKAKIIIETVDKTKRLLELLQPNRPQMITKTI
ncbi:Bartonella effector protein (Bep); substrate of VirB T4SS [Bartonella clarridgeiae 73]|uniref:protein adenylyltransferase n=1 Tax=Bartonella clarridgeiae (strain CCUG 45776 / CIP 104772 / 73) TaxID=696125 RepID=E6YHH5_BARC7|nr:BID domain-containing T4SS effector [Bartonella clarridgeiae]CBI76313.1 Bartonella effector protein (Bep); substrate of VirB T4SS [Bartonella clarridgeiae 73]